VASNDAVRAVFAWGMLPSILGLAVILSMAAGWRIIAPGSEPRLLSSLFDLVNGACGLWGVVVTFLMLFGLSASPTAFEVPVLDRIMDIGVLSLYTIGATELLLPPLPLLAPPTRGVGAEFR
jgi:hypothetical protein